MSDVRGWLDSIGLGQYAGAFEENAIEPDLLGDLTDDDLRTLGVAALGHRKRILKAASGPAEAPASPAPGAPAADREPVIPARQAERRPLTVMFCDLVGSTALTARLGPEDFRELLVGYQAAARDAIARFDGYIARYMGDGLLVYFGYPHAHEDDAERAVRAGLAISASVGLLESATGVALATRIGIATGLVVAGDIVGEGASEEHAVLGDTPNLAARLQGSAQPGTVIVSEATYRLVQGLFECSARAPELYKGFGEPLPSWSVESERVSDTRFEARLGRGLTPLVGRQSELSLLLERWEQAKDGDGQVVLLSGEPGIGKSRLTQELRQRVAQEASRVLRYQCSPYHAQSAFHPVITALERDMHLSAADSEQHRLEKLEAMLERNHTRLDTALGLFAALLSVPVGADLGAVDLGDQRQRQRLMDALVGQTLRIAQQGGPVLSIFEDAHWMDPSTAEVLGLLVDAIQDVPGLVLVTGRPEFQPPWVGRNHVSLQALKRLGRRHRLAMMDGLAGSKSLPEEVVDTIVSKADGVPLYVEELMRSVLQGGYLRELDDRYELMGDLSRMGIPTTLHDSLVARLDRMGKAKDVAQLCAAIGRESPQALLAEVWPHGAAELDAALDHLADSQLLTRRQHPGGITYTFKHALLQDAAYDSLLHSTRRQLHGDIAAALQRSFPDLGESEPEVLAHHHTEAAQWAQAIACWEQAGLRARARSANREAADHLGRALHLLAEQPESAARDRDELRMLMAFGASVVQVEGFTSPNVERTYLRALALSERLQTLTEGCVATRGLQIYHLMGGKVARSRQFGEQLMDLARSEPHGSYVVGGHQALGQILFLGGQFGEARTVLEAGVERYDQRRHRPANWPGGQPGEQCHLYLALTLWMLGCPDRARVQLDLALSLMEANPTPVSVTSTETFAAMLYFFLRDSARLRAHAEHGFAVSKEYRIVVFEHSCRIMRGASLLMDGETGEGAGGIRAGLEALDAIAFMAWRPLWLAALVDPALNPAATKHDLAAAREAAARSAENGERFFDAEMRRLEGEQARACEPEVAEQRLREAMDIARRQCARSLELRAATSLASLLREQGRSREARAILVPVHAWFSEGFDTADLRAASALLDTLA